jgi:tetratricopeptide (TPR) repeat protein
MLFLAHGFGPQAYLCLRHAEARDGKDPRWPYLQTVILAQDEPDPGAVLPKLERAVALCRDNPDAPRLRLAEALLAAGRATEAKAHYAGLLTRTPQHPAAHLGLARVALEQGQLHECLAHLPSSAASPFTQKAAAALGAEAYQRLGDQAAAARELARLARLPEDRKWPDPFREEVQKLGVGLLASITRAGNLAVENRYPEAIALLQRVVANYPDSDNAWQSLGSALSEHGDYAGAERALERALAINAHSVQAHFLLGVALFGREQITEAICHFQEATTLKPDFALAYYNLGRCYQMQNDRPSAIAAFRQAVACRPPWSEAHRELATVLDQAGRRDDALAEARLAADLKPEDELARNLLKKLRGPKSDGPRGC